MSYLQLTNESFEHPGRKHDSGNKSTALKYVNDENDPEGLYSQLIMCKADRLKADEEARMLKNRIGLLVLEEQKAQKKIEDTKKKAKTILELKLQNQQDLILKEEAKLLKMKQEHEQFLRNKQQRAALVDNRGQATRNHQKKSCERANRIRQQNQECKELSKSLTENVMLKKVSKVAKIKAHQHQAILRKITNVEKRVAESKSYYDSRIKTESDVKHKLTDEIVKLEMVELELIRKLQNTRQEQLSHLEQLDRLKNTKFTLISGLQEQLEAFQQTDDDYATQSRSRSASAERSGRFRYD